MDELIEITLEVIDQKHKTNKPRYFEINKINCKYVADMINNRFLFKYQNEKS